MMSPVRILLIEDYTSDARLVEAVLAGGKADFPFTLTRVERLAEGLVRLREQVFDAVLTDLGLPDSQGLKAIEELRKSSPQLPIIVLTVDSDQEIALGAIKAGAQDYLPKGQLSGLLLARTIRHAIERQKVIDELQAALAEVKALSVLLPICASCKKVRDDQGYWNQIETYLAKHTTASFSHGFCPECGEKFLNEGGIKRGPKLSL